MTKHVRMYKIDSSNTQHDEESVRMCKIDKSSMKQEVCTILIAVI